MIYVTSKLFIILILAIKQPHGGVTDNINLCLPAEDEINKSRTSINVTCSCFDKYARYDLGEADFTKRLFNN